MAATLSHRTTHNEKHKAYLRETIAPRLYHFASNEVKKPPKTTTGDTLLLNMLIL